MFVVLDMHIYTSLDMHMHLSKLLSQPTEKLNEYMHDESDF